MASFGQDLSALGDLLNSIPDERESNATTAVGGAAPTPGSIGPSQVYKNVKVAEAKRDPEHRHHHSSASLCPLSDYCFLPPRKCLLAMSKLNRLHWQQWSNPLLTFMYPSIIHVFMMRFTQATVFRH